MNWGKSDGKPLEEHGVECVAYLPSFSSPSSFTDVFLLMTEIILYLIL